MYYGHGGQKREQGSSWWKEWESEVEPASPIELIKSRTEALHSTLETFIPSFLRRA